MFKQYLFTTISCLLSSRLARNYQEHHGPCEDAYSARVGPLHLELNHCFVLDHQDAAVSLRLPVHSSHLHLGYVLCQGQDQVRQPGFYARWHKPLPKVVYGQGKADPDNSFPF